jgi:serine/threonine-protein kinase
VNQSSLRFPALLAVFGVLVAGIAAVVVWQLWGKSSDGGAPGPASVLASAATPARPASPAVTAGVGALPASAIPCPQLTPASGAFSQSATGSAVTSCPFAEEVRKVYAAGGGPTPQPRSVAVASPVTGQRYTMACAAVGALVTCRGEQNALVYLY